MEELYKTHFVRMAKYHHWAYAKLINSFRRSMIPITRRILDYSFIVCIELSTVRTNQLPPPPPPL